MSQPASRRSSSVPAIMNSMSSGWAAIAKARGRSLLLTGDFANAHRPSFTGRLVRSRHHPMRGECVAETRQRHVFATFQGVEERLELREIWMIANVAAIEQLHRQLAPGVTVQSSQLLRVKLVVENAAFAAHEMRVEVVRL